MWLWLSGCTLFSEDNLTDWEQRYTDSPEQVVALLETIDNPSERLSIVQSLQEAFPGQTEDLCTVLDAAAQEYCVERNRRPHLWMPLKQATPSDSSTIVPSGSNCTSVSCRITEALPLAQRGQIHRVSQVCSTDSLTETHECLFATAEKLVSQRGVLKYDVAVDICEEAASFSGNCQNHLIQQLAKWAPDADSQSDWDTIIQAHRAIETTWNWRSQEKKSQLQHRLWSEALGASYAGADTVVGNPLDVVPEEYHTHIYSASAWRLFQLQEPSSRSFTEWTSYLADSLAKRSQRSESVDQQRKFRAASNLWKTNDALEGDVVVPYLSTSHRLKGDSVDEELALSILEAIARHPPVEMTILETGLLDERERVNRTAKRLLAQQPNVE